MKHRILKSLPILLLLVCLLTAGLSTCLAETNDTKQASTGKILLLQANASSGSKIKLTWNKIKDATGYELYGAEYGKSFKKIKQVKKSNLSVSKLNGKKLKAGKVYSFYALALNGEEQIARSLTITVIAGDTTDKYGNATSIKVDTKTYKLESGKTAKIKVTTNIKNKSSICLKNMVLHCVISLPIQM